MFYAGPENAANQYTVPCTSLFEFAQKLQASAIIGVEHRFFGHSWPDNVNPSNFQSILSSLTLENVLGDYIAVIRNFTHPAGPYPNARVIAFGGSYGGFLSAMLRIRYPGDVYGALASAAPVALEGSSVDQGLWCVTLYSHGN